MKKLRGKYKFKVITTCQDNDIKIKFPKGSILIGTSFPSYYVESKIEPNYIIKLFVLIPVKKETNEKE